MGKGFKERFKYVWLVIFFGGVILWFMKDGAYMIGELAVRAVEVYLSIFSFIKSEALQLIISGTLAIAVVLSFVTWYYGEQTKQVQESTETLKEKSTSALWKDVINDRAELIRVSVGTIRKIGIPKTEEELATVKECIGVYDESVKRMNSYICNIREYVAEQEEKTSQQPTYSFEDGV